MIKMSSSTQDRESCNGLQIIGSKSQFQAQCIKFSKPHLLILPASYAVLDEVAYLPSQDFELDFELDFRVVFSSQDFLSGIFSAGFKVNFQWFYTTYFVSGVAYCLEVFSRCRRAREDGRSVTALLFNLSQYCIRYCIFDWRQQLTLQ